MMKLLDRVDWTPLPKGFRPKDDLPVATHEGILRIGDFTLKVYQLNNGQRIVDAESVAELFGGLEAKNDCE